MKKWTLLFLCITGALSYGQKAQSPSEFLGYELGTWFSRHHQVVDYYEHLATSFPDRVKLEPYGNTYEGRPLFIAYISSASNLSNLDSIRQTHLNSMNGEGDASTAIVWLSYNVHGNESVSTEASMRTAWELLTERQELLENTVVVIDPCINPDGRDRYVNWYNQFKNTPNNPDINSKEHREPWLSGRPNHYMFDLNRDWVWITQTESRQRLKVFSKWYPHVHVDFHEQGLNEPYYFAPAAEPLHEVITPWQKEFQVSLGKNHAKYFDKNGWYYFTKEHFDLLYPSYGDTYPTYNGAIGMTYEQGGSGVAGLAAITTYGDTLTLKDRIAHHHTTGMSTVELSAQNAAKLNEEFRNYYKNPSFTYQSYVMQGDRDKIKSLTSLLDAHGIDYSFTRSAVKGYSFDKGGSGQLSGDGEKLVVSTNQTKGKLVKVLFEPQTKLNDSLTYDITAWSLPYAYGLDAVASTKLVQAGETMGQRSLTAPENQNTYAWITNWNSMKDARFLADLLTRDIKVRYHTLPFTVNGKSFDRGSLIISKSDNAHIKNLVGLLSELQQKHGKDLFGTPTGFVDAGKDFGSDKVRMIRDVKVAAFSGDGVSTLSFGEVWHFFEQQLGYPVTVLDERYLSRVDLSDYHVLVLPETYRLSDNHREQIKDWVRNGGKLIAIGDALEVLAGDEDFKLKIKSSDTDSITTQDKLKPYGGREREYIKELITGAVYKAQVDPTHPLSYGYGDTYYTLKLSGTAYEYLDSGNAAYLANGASPLSGFAGSEAARRQPESLLAGSVSLGRGECIYLTDNPLFRGFWENGKLFMANAVYMTGNP